MNVGDKDDDLQKEVHTVSKIYKNVHSIDARKTFIQKLDYEFIFTCFNFEKKKHKTTFILETN